MVEAQQCQSYWTWPCQAAGVAHITGYDILEFEEEISIRARDALTFRLDRRISEQETKVSPKSSKDPVLLVIRKKDP